MKLWMDVMRDLEALHEEPQRLFDAWEAGGVDGLVLGPMLFDCPKLLPGIRTVPAARAASATFDPDPRVYRRLGVEPPPAPPDPDPDLERRAALARDLA